ncbi:MAG: hypothetical protein QW797_00260 [Thermoproteota archaeon]
MLEPSLGLLETAGRIGVAGGNFRSILVYLLSEVFKDTRIILFDLNDEFSCVSRIRTTRYCNIVKHSVNPVKPPCPERVERYIESLVEILDYCFGAFNVKSILTKALLDNVSKSTEATIPEIASKLDFETPEGGLSIYTPFEPFTFGTLKQAFGRRESFEFNDVLESGVVFDFFGLAAASHKVFATLLVLEKLAQLEPVHQTIVVVNDPSMVWPRNRRRDNAQLFVEGVLLEELERKGYSIIIAEKTLSEVSEKVLRSLDSIVFSPPAEVFNPWGASPMPDRSVSSYSMLVLTRSGDSGLVKAPVNMFMKPLDEKEREDRKPALKSFSGEDRLRDDLGEYYEAGVKVMERVRGLGGKASLNRIVEEVRSILGANGLRALAALLRQGYLKQVQEAGEQYLVSKEDWFE